MAVGGFPPNADPGASALPADPAAVGRQVAPETARGGFREFFMQPQVLAAVLQAVQSLASSNRQDTVGRLGDALGAAGGAVGRVQATERATAQAAAQQEIAGRRATAEETRAGAATAQAETGVRRADLEERQLGVLQEQFERSLAVKKGTQASRLLTAVINAEIERSFLSGDEPDLDRITSQFEIFRRLTTGADGDAAAPAGAAPGGVPTAGAAPATPTTFSQVTDINALSEPRLVQALQGGGVAEQVLRRQFGDAAVDAKRAELEAAGRLGGTAVEPGVLPAFGSNR